MKNLPSILKRAEKIIFILVIFFIPAICSAQLNGAFTINPKAAASATNYRNWASVVNDLLLGVRTDGGTARGPGVNAKVTFSVYDTVYANTQLQFTSIAGASSTNDITFTSMKGDSSKCTIQYPSGSTAADDYVLMLNGAKYITFQRMGFERTGTNSYSTVVQILGAANKNRISNCRLKGRKLPSATSPGFIWGIGSCVYFMGEGDTTTISNNKMIYGYNGIYAAVNCLGNTISGNVMDTIGSSGIYMTLQTNLKIIGNTFNMGDFGASAGHYVSYAVRVETSPSVVISKNKMLMTAVNCQVVRAIVLVSVSSTAASPTLITNNFISNSGGTTNCCGIAIYGCSYLDFYYNNVLITNSLGNGTCLYHNPTYTNSAVKMVNNNLINKGGGYVFDVYYSDLDTVDYNNCYTNGTNFGNWTNVLYPTYSAWNSASGKNVNSINVDPGYISNINLHVSSIAINGKAKPYFRVTDDIDGQIRNTVTPDIGADEFFPISGDAGISGLDSPMVFCPAVKNVKVTFQNYGYDTIYNVKLNWQVNGVTQTIYNWSGTIYPGKSSASIRLGSYNFLPNTPYTIKVWTSLPNGKTDGNLINDTIKLLRYAGMSGIYTISDTVLGANYKSFNNAITDMTTRGICGPITFNVYPGIYNEQITLWQLPGMGASNPIIFQNLVKDSTKVVIRLASANATGVNNAILQLNGADYVTFKGITLLRLTTGYTIAEVLHILNGANNNTFTNCQMIGTYVTSASATGYNIWSDQSTDNNNVFRNNYVKLGTTCMTYLGTSTAHERGTVIEGNIFDSAYNNLVDISYNDNIIIRNNTFLNNRVPVTGNYNLQLSYCDSAIRVTANVINDSVSASAIQLTTCNAIVSKPGIIANNFISKYSGNGIMLNGVNYIKTVFNSIYMRGSVTTNAGIATSTAASTNILLMNNNIEMEAGYVYNIPTATQISASDYNNLYAKGSQFAIWGTSTYANFSGYKTGVKKDSNSISVDPLFRSPFDLHFSNMALNGAGVPVSGVTTDIDGETRSTTKPDIGADEYIQLSTDAGIKQIVSPQQYSCDGQYTVVVKLYNYGLNPITSVDINWTVNGVPKSTYHFSKTLASLKDTTLIIGIDTFYTGKNYKIVARTNLPNGLNDLNKSNDADSVYNIKIYAQPVIRSVAGDTICKNTSATLFVHSNNTKVFYWWDQIIGGKIVSQDSAFITPKLTATKIYFVEGATPGYPYSLTTTNGTSMSEMGNMFTVRALSNDVNIDSFAISPYVAKGSIVPVDVWYRRGTFRGVESNPAKWTYLGTDTVVSLGIGNFVSISVGNIRIPALDSFAFYISSTDPNALLNYTDGSRAISDKNIVITTGAKLYYPFDITYVSNKTWNGVVYYSTGAMCRTSRIPVYAVVNKTPAVNLGVDTSICFGNKITLNAGSGTGYTYVWKYNNLTSAISNKQSITVDSGGNYHVYVTDTCGFTDRDTISITVNKKPVASFNVSDSIECFMNNKFLFTNTSNISSGIISSYLWTFSDGNTDIAKNPAHSFISPNTYSVRLKAISDKGCADSTSSKKLFVLPSPVAEFSINDTSQCLKTNKFRFIDNSSISSGKITSKKWYLGDGNFKNDTNTYYSYLKDSVYAVKLIAISSLGCSDTIVKLTYVYPDPFVSFTTNDSSQCLNTNHFIFTNNSSIKTGSMNFNWFYGDGDTSSAVNTSHDYKVAKSFSVILNALSSNSCPGQYKKTIYVKPMPVVNLGKDTTLFDYQSILLDAGAGYDSYLWSNGKNSQTILVDSNGIGIGSKLFSVNVVLKGCDGTDTIKISFIKKTDIKNAELLSLKIFPNPATDFVNIEFKTSNILLTLSVIDLNGKIVKQIKLSRLKNYQLDISDMDKGVYFLNLKGDMFNEILRLMKL